MIHKATPSVDYNYWLKRLIFLIMSPMLGLGIEKTTPNPLLPILSRFEKKASSVHIFKQFKKMS